MSEDEQRRGKADPPGPPDPADALTPQDATSTWAPPSATFDDVLFAGDPLASTAPATTPDVVVPPLPSPGPQDADPYAAPPPPPPPDYGPAPVRPAEPEPSSWLPVPPPPPWASDGSPAPQDVSPTPPAYAPRPPLPPPPTSARGGPPGGTPVPPGAPGPRRRRRTRTRPGRTPAGAAVALAAVVALVIGGAVVAGLVGRGRDSGSSSRPSATEPPLGTATPAPAGSGSAVAVTPVTDPQRVRLEVVSAGDGPATLRYSGDNKDTTRLRDITLPWAVEAPVGGSTYVSVSASDSSGLGRAERPVMRCRIWLDGVLVDEETSRGAPSCSAYVDRFRTTRLRGDGAALAGVVPATPEAVTLPALPVRASTVTVEGYSSVPTQTLSARFGSGGTANKVELEDQAAPFARQASIPAGVDLISLSVSDYETEPTPTLLCRILLDGVVVRQTASPGSASCSLSLSGTLGS